MDEEDRKLLALADKWDEREHHGEKGWAENAKRLRRIVEIRQNAGRF